jgi:hypothetical protein
MTVRDLIYRIVPTKVVIRELKTTNGKVLKKNCEYTLVEKQRHVTIGKKTHVDYIYELDLKEDENIKDKNEEEETVEQKKAKKKRIFRMNLEDFSIFKLKSTVFFVFFPLTLTETIINLWVKLVPNGVIQKKTKEDPGANGEGDDEVTSGFDSESIT